MAHTYPEIPQSAMLMLQLQNQEAEALTGVKAFSGGLSGDAYGEVAAGIKGILDAAAKREMSILRRLAGGLVRIGKKMIAMNAVFLSDEEVIRVTNVLPVVPGIGHNGGPALDDDKAKKLEKSQFVSIFRDELPGEFDLKVDISTAEVDAAKSQDLAFMLQTMGPTMDFSITKMILAEITRLKRMPELSHAIMLYEPKPDPMEEELKKLQLEAARKEVEKLQSEIDLNLARAKKEETEAEQVVLDTVEQETGTTHARELEKQVAQSTGNQALAVTQALLKPRKWNETPPDIDAAIGYNEMSKVMHDPRTGATSTTSPPMPLDLATPGSSMTAAQINAMAGPGAGGPLPGGPMAQIPNMPPPPEQQLGPPEMGGPAALPPGAIPEGVDIPDMPEPPAPPPIA
jgi:hypothetical protein